MEKAVEHDYQSEDDARTLERHAEIAGNGKRHSAALKHMKKKIKTHKEALELSKHVRKGLKQAFPKEGKSGHEKAEPKAEAKVEND
jgi:hypothetical protein